MKLLFASTLSTAWLLLLLAPQADASSLKGAAKAATPSKRTLKTTVMKPNYRECEVDESKDEVKMTCRATNNPMADEEKRGSKDEGEGEDESMEAQARGIVLAPAIEIRDKIKYKVETGKKGVEVEVTYEQEFEEMDGDAEGESKTKFKIVFESIVEYAKAAPSENETMHEDPTPEDQAYDWNADEVVQVVDLEKWNELSTVASDGVVSHFFASSEDQVVAFNFSIRQADQGEKLTVNTMKIDLHIVGFPWMRNDTFLALTSTVSSKMDVDVKHDDKAEVLLPQDDVQIPFASAVDTVGFVPIGSYKWDSAAEALESDANATEPMLAAEPIDVGKAEEEMAANLDFVSVEKYSHTIQVIATSPMEYGNETTQLIAYSFVGAAAQNASYIYWDPEAGIDYASTNEEEYVMGENGMPLDYDLSGVSAGFTRRGVVVGLVAAAVTQVFALA